MRSITCRAGLAAAFMAAALVTGCGESVSDQVERADANARNAIARAASLASRVSELEARLERLERHLNL